MALYIRIVHNQSRIYYGECVYNLAHIQRHGITQGLTIRHTDGSLCRYIIIITIALYNNNIIHTTSPWPVVHLNYPHHRHPGPSLGQAWAAVGVGVDVDRQALGQGCVWAGMYIAPHLYRAPTSTLSA